MTTHSTPLGLSAVQRDILAVLVGATLKDTAIRALLEDHYDAELERGHLDTTLGELVEAGLIARIECNDSSDVYRLTAPGRRYIQGHAAWLQAETASRGDEGVSAETGLDTQSELTATSTNRTRVADGGLTERDIDEEPGECRAVCSDQECPFDNAYDSLTAASRAASEHAQETNHVVAVADDAAAFVRNAGVDGETMQEIVATLNPDSPTDSGDSATHDRGGEHHAE